MNIKDTGGQPFPDFINDEGIRVYQHGMTLRDYFIAHTPKVPEWFKPVMSKDKPKQIFDETNGFNYTVPKNQKEIDEYDLEYKKLKFFQWRTYYADAMIKERGINND